MAGTGNSSRGQIQRVSSLLPQMEKDKSDYLPEGVSIGPYHHGDPKLALVEAFKPRAVDLFISGGTKNKDFYINKVVDIIGKVRSCYIQTSMNKVFTDAELAQMMLKDASLIIIFMEISVPAQSQPVDDRVREKFTSIKEHLGMLAFTVLSRDLYLLDNQIPLFVIKLLVDSRYRAGRGGALVDRFLYLSFFGEYRCESLQQGQEPLHLLEATHRLLTVGGNNQPAFGTVAGINQPASGTVGTVAGNNQAASGAVGTVVGINQPPSGIVGTMAGNNQPASGTAGTMAGINQPASGTVGTVTGNNQPASGTVDLETGQPASGTRNIKSGDADRSNIKSLIPIFRAATDLKAKGIHFRPSPTPFLSDASLHHCLFKVTLRLPQYGVSTRTKVLLRNMVAYELSPGSPTEREIISYINLMKSLLERPEDVKELREKRIIHNMLGSDEEVLAVFKDISTHGSSGTLYKDVNEQIREHCNSRMNTWMAEFIHTHFRSPWSILASLGAVLVLALAAAQLHYAVHPPKKEK